MTETHRTIVTQIAKYTFNIYYNLCDKVAYAAIMKEEVPSWFTMNDTVKAELLDNLYASYKIDEEYKRVLLLREPLSLDGLKYMGTTTVSCTVYKEEICYME